jgi:[ribosomal protein S5]-alanine N-acetyltransferase
MTAPRTAPEHLETERLVLRRPVASDAPAVFERYAADPDVTRLLGWATHRAIDDTRAFLAFSDLEWGRWPAGPYLILSRGDGRLLGGTGIAFETARRASTGYVLAKDSWGLGFATEALLAIVGVAQAVGVRRLYALCHANHHPSARVLEKCGFVREGILRRYQDFPNLPRAEPSDVLCYARVF